MAPELLAAGETTVLRAGDSVVERPGPSHEFNNAGTEPVVFLVTTLFREGEPIFVFVDATPVP